MVQGFAAVAALCTGARFLAASETAIGPVPYEVGYAWWGLTMVAAVVAFVEGWIGSRIRSFIAGGIVAISYALWPGYVAIVAPSLTSGLGATAAHFLLTSAALAVLYASLPARSA